jgi:hypothetical protein
LAKGKRDGRRAPAFIRDIRAKRWQGWKNRIPKTHRFGTDFAPTLYRLAAGSGGAAIFRGKNRWPGAAAARLELLQFRSERRQAS